MAVALQLSARLAYVIGVGTMLWRQDHLHWLTGRYGIEGGYRRFRRIASTIMDLDGLLFIAVCILTRGTLGTPWPVGLRVTIGVAAVVIGGGVKIWARKTLGSAGYHWRDFFYRDETTVPRRVGPYRYLKNPMYTVGYLQAYGLALVVDSAPGLVLAAIMQAAILGFYFVVERPHVNELRKSPTD